MRVASTPAASGKSRIGAALLLVAVLGGCGGGEEPAPERATPAATAQTAEADRPLEIAEPAAGTRVDGRFVGANRVAGRVTVSGSARAGATILLSGGCTALNCRALVRAGDDGEWTGALRVEGTVRRPRATVSASDPGGEGNARVTVRLRVPDRPPTEAEVELSEREPPARPRGPAPRALVVVGDSLAVGTEPLLPGLLDGWSVTQDAMKNRTLAQGMETLRAIPLSGDPVVLAFSLFTNDDPRNVDALEAAVRESVALAGPGGCAVWATIARPPFSGVSYAAANARLESLTFDPELAGRLFVVPWADAVAARPAWLASDQVHATPEGYGGRAQMYADAARSCGA